MNKFVFFSYVLFFISFTAQMIDFIFAGSDYFYSHFLQWMLLMIGVSPFIGFVLALYGSGKFRIIAVVLNLFFFVAFGLLALLNFWIMTFGK